MSDAAVAAVIAACIGAAASLLGLIISKEQKTSDFRQAWIDALRAELCTYLTKINSISDFVKYSSDSKEKKVQSLIELYASLNGAAFNISLRINKNENKSKRLIEAMGKFNKLFSTGEIVQPDQIRPIESEFIDSAQELLRYEWRRVKSGELTFVIAKWASALILLSALILGGYVVTRQVPKRAGVVETAEKGVQVNVAVSAPASDGPALGRNVPMEDKPKGK